MAIATETSTSTALRNFLSLSPCPFSQRARIRCGGPWSDPRPLPERLDDLHAEMLELSASEDCDLLVLELEQADELRTPRDLAAMLHATLAGLRARDPASQKPLAEGVDRPDWDFEHGGEKFFISLFAPLYPASHSRFSGHESVAFVLFQPERSFRRFGVSSRRPHRERLSRAVQQRFHRHGKEYDAAQNAGTPKALRFIKPADGDDAPIAWWRVPYDADVG